MAVLRIVPNLTTPDIATSQAFYHELLGLDVAMDMGWIVTMTTGLSGPVQLSLANQGGADTPVPDLSIEVDNLDEIYARATKMGARIPYPMTTESWGIRRFFVSDPTGRILNISSHVGDNT